jgi:hypothetical protein
MGRPVRAAPLPISALAAVMVTMPSLPIDTKIFGLLTVPLGMEVAPVG